jgi:hypothetical protein
MVMPVVVPGGAVPTVTAVALELADGALVALAVAELLIVPLKPLLMVAEKDVVNEAPGARVGVVNVTELGVGFVQVGEQELGTNVWADCSVSVTVTPVAGIVPVLRVTMIYRI